MDSAYILPFDEKVPSDERIADYKVRILRAMAANKIVRIEAEYSGSGDSGQFDGIVFDPPLTQSVKLENTKGKLVDLDEFVEEFVGVLEREYHDGYENNDGGCGRIVIEAVSATITYERTDYFTDSRIETDEF